MTPGSSKIFVPNRCLGYISNHIPLQVRYIKSRKENLIITCVGKAFHTYGISHFGLLSVSGLHESDIECMAADAFHVYTSCGATIYAWRRGTELQHVYYANKDTVHLMLPFGAHLIAIDKQSRVKVWDIKDETSFLELNFHNDAFEITTISHPNTYINKILFGSRQGSMQLWNLNTAKLIYTFKGWDIPITCLQQAPALDVVAVGLQSGRVILHNLKFDETLMEFSQDWGCVTSISFRTDGHPIMATGSDSGHIVFWNLEEKKVTSQLMNAHDGSVTGMVCLSSEPLMLTSSPDNTLKLWIFDMTDGGARLLRIREGHSAAPLCIRFHGANGCNILSSGGDSSLRIFNTQTEQFNKSLGKASYNRKASKKRGHGTADPLKMPPIVQFTSETTREKEWDNIAAIHSGLSQVTSWSYDRLKMGDLKFLPERLFKKKNINSTLVAATCLCLTHCNNFVIIGYSDGYADRFNMQSGLWRHSYGNPAHDGATRGIAADCLNQIVVTGGDCKLKFWGFKNVKDSNCIKELDLAEPVNFMTSYYDSSLLAVALEDFSIVVIDIDSFIMVRKFEGHVGQLTDIAFTPDCRWLISSAMDCSIRVWDLPSARLVDQFRTESACTSLTMSPTGEMLATAHVGLLGIFLWSNKLLYEKITLHALSPADEPPLIELPEVNQVINVTDEEPSELERDESEFVSPKQISSELITLSGLPSSRWLNLLDMDVIKQRNKPKAPPKAPRAAPFFLPTVSSLTFQFDLSSGQQANSDGKLVLPKELFTLTPFGKLLMDTENNFEVVVEKLAATGPATIDFEIRSLSSELCGSPNVLLKFLKLIEFMFKSNQGFELAEAYLAAFLKAHGRSIAREEPVRNYLVNIQNLHSHAWHKLQQKMLYSLCIIQHLKTV